MRQTEFRLLGPLEALEGDRPLALGGGKQRALLAVLLLHANEVVSSDRLIDELWGETPPATAAKIVQVYVSRLRKQLGDDRLVTRAPGYVLLADRDELDVGRFERLVGEARVADPRTAGETLRAALALSRGPPLADLAYEPFAQAEIVRLQEMCWAALELRIDADLAVGQPAELIGELEALVTAHPLRERLRAQLMLALYRCSRQAEALETYRRARRDLADGLGLEPGDELRQLEQAILRQDPELGAESPRVAGPVRERCLVVAPRELAGVDALLSLAEPLASTHDVIVTCVVAREDLASATAGLASRRETLLERGLHARTAAFSSPTPDSDLVRLAARNRAGLLLTDAAPETALGLLEHTPCDVALLVAAGGPPRPGPVLVPFGGGHHDWAALELAAWVSRATGVPLRLIGAGASGDDGRDASRLLADASLILQRTASVVAEPVLAEPGRSGVRAAAADAGLLVVGLSDRWRQEGLGRTRAGLVEAPPAPTVLVRRGPRPSSLAPDESATRFGWSLTAGVT